MSLLWEQVSRYGSGAYRQLVCFFSTTRVLQLYAPHRLVLLYSARNRVGLAACVMYHSARTDRDTFDRRSQGPGYATAFFPLSFCHVFSGCRSFYPMPTGHTGDRAPGVRTCLI